MTDKDIHDFLSQQSHIDKDVETGIVFAGGGAKGAYQIGVIKALQENGYLNNVKAMSGTSIGCINSMLYAMDDIDNMIEAWADINLSTVFSLDVSGTINSGISFSREELLKTSEKYIDYDKLKNGKYDIFSTICMIGADKYGTETVAEYRKLSDYDTDTIKKIMLASTALPVIYEPVEIAGKYYRDGGLCDNVPIKPIYELGLKRIIVIETHHDAKINPEKWPDTEIIPIVPSYDLGDIVTGTLDFTEKSIEFKKMLGYKDGIRAIKTQFEKNEIYIRMEKMLAQNDLNEINMTLRTAMTVNTMEKSISSNIDKFNKLAEKYENY